MRSLAHTLGILYVLAFILTYGLFFPTPPCHQLKAPPHPNAAMVQSATEVRTHQRRNFRYSLLSPSVVLPEIMTIKTVSWAQPLIFILQPPHAGKVYLLSYGPSFFNPS